MIRPADNSTSFDIASSDPFITRILSLYMSYGEGYDFVGFWEQKAGESTAALISRFEDKFSLWLTDGADMDEIAAFVRFQGAGSVMYNAEYVVDIPHAAHTIEGRVLEYIGDNYNSDKEIYEPAFKELYGLLKICESDIFRVPDYMMFLSDLTHRRNMDKLHLIGTDADGALASSVMTVSEAPSSAIIGAVATRPDCRGRGLSRDLVRTLATRLRSEGRRVYVLSASDANTHFYINSGFKVVAGFKEIFLR